MATITLRNIPDAVMAALKTSALANRRSMNQEAVVWLEKASMEGLVLQDLEREIAEITKLRLASIPLSPKEIDNAKRQGRA